MAKLKLKKKLPKSNKKAKEVIKKYANLDEVIDKTKLFTMIYSGVEQSNYFDVLYNLGIRDFLMSYHYLKGKAMEQHSSVSKLIHDDTRLFIDSGAFTYLTNAKYHDYTLEQWEMQIKEYLNWARENKDMIFAMADLDLQDLVGLDVVTKWRRQYFEPFMLETGVPVAFVWHASDGLEQLDKMCERYPYISISWATDKANDGVKLLKIAEKHNTLVHGLGMTQTSNLTKLPFFTVDSTTWLAGLKYGEVNYWRGTKMSRLKKEKWKGDYLPKIMNKYGEEYNIDQAKLLAEDTTELIKINVLPFIEAEKYIREKLKSRMYWLKPTTSKKNVEDLKFPPSDWIIDKKDDEWEEYCNSLNIGTTNADDAITNLVDMTCFCCWDDPELTDYIKDTYTSELLQELHDLHINRIVPDDETRISDLRTFFLDCATGKNDTLLLDGTNFQLRPKERESYLEEEEFEYRDMTKEGVLEQLFSSSALPAPKDGTGAPELDALEDEIFKDADIIPVRDANGRFVKGQKKVLKPKNIYSKKYPKLACDTCYAAQTCPEHQSGMVCAFNKMFDRFDTRNPNDIVEAMSSLVNLNMERTQRAAIFEMLDGGIPDGNLTMLIDMNVRLLSNLKRMQDAGVMQMIKKTTTINSDGSTEETVQLNSNATNSGGILEQLFKRTAQKEEEEKQKYDNKDIIDVDIKDTID